MKTYLYISSFIVLALLMAVGGILIARGPKQQAEEPEETQRLMEIETLKEVPVEKEVETTAVVIFAGDSDGEPGYNQPETETVYTVEEAAAYVLDAGINGDQREEVLGEMYEEVQNWIDDNHVPETVVYTDDTVYTEDYYEEPVTWGGDVLDPSDGVTWYNGHMETYYNLPMEGVLEIMYSLGYSGDYWVRGDGCKMFGPYIMVAADFGWLPRGTVVETSLGTGIVCDTGAGGWNWLDIAVTW